MGGLQCEIARNMKHGQEIHHTGIVAPFASWRLYIPEPLHILTSQGTVFLIVTISQSKSSHSIGSCHAFSIVARRLSAIQVELSSPETIIFEERK